MDFTFTEDQLLFIDNVAKFMRTGLRNFMGKFNITQGFLDTLS
jgi:hypothetical protein